jgi:hypothetical protein
MLHCDDAPLNLWPSRVTFQCGVRAAAELSRARQAAHAAPTLSDCTKRPRYNLLPHFRDTPVEHNQHRDVDAFEDDPLERVALRPEDPRDLAWRDGPARGREGWIAQREEAATVTAQPSDDFDQSDLGPRPASRHAAT